MDWTHLFLWRYSARAAPSSRGRTVRRASAFGIGGAVHVISGDNPSDRRMGGVGC
jgi:hypothetical protein